MRLLRDRIAAFDRRALVLLQSRESAALTRAMRTLTHLGDPGSWVVVGLALAASGGRGPRLATLLSLGAGLAVAASQLLKRLCCRPRPSTAAGAGAPRIEDPDAFSFPSGHTAAAFGVAAALAGEAHGLALLTLTLAGAIGLSRVPGRPLPFGRRRRRPPGNARRPRGAAPPGGLDDQLLPLPARVVVPSGL